MYDVIVVGGGAAGLSGALMLARSKRSVLVIDAGTPRNAPADGVHGLEAGPLWKRHVLKKLLHA